MVGSYGTPPVSAGGDPRRRLGGREAARGLAARSGLRMFAEPFSATVPGSRPRCRFGRERDEWSRQRQRGKLHQEQDVVIAGGLVQAQSATVGAAVNENPARLGADRDRDRLHVACAVRLPVAGNVAVEVP